MYYYLPDIYAGKCIYVCMYVCKYVCMYVCMYMCVCTYVHVLYMSNHKVMRELM